MLVMALPLIAGIVLFVSFDAFHLSDKYIGPIAFLFSSFFIWFFDGGPAVLREGFGKVEKSRHTLFWIEIKYWALVLALIGCVWLGELMAKGS